MRLIPPISARLPDATAERVRRNHDERIRELQSIPVLHGKLVLDIELTSGDEIVVPHNYGRTATIILSPPRGASSTGRIEEIRSSSYDGRNVSVLKATGWGATITVDAWVF